MCVYTEITHYLIDLLETYETWYRIALRFGILVIFGIILQHIFKKPTGWFGISISLTDLSNCLLGTYITKICIDINKISEFSSNEWYRIEYRILALMIYLILKSGESSSIIASNLPETCTVDAKVNYKRKFFYNFYWNF